MWITLKYVFWHSDREYEHEYEVTPTKEIISKYFCNRLLKKGKSKEFIDGFKNAVEELYLEDWLNEDALEEDDDFIDYLKDYYFDQAKEEFDDQMSDDSNSYAKWFYNNTRM